MKTITFHFRITDMTYGSLGVEIECELGPKGEVEFLGTKDAEASPSDIEAFKFLMGGQLALEKLYNRAFIDIYGKPEETPA